MWFCLTSLGTIIFFLLQWFPSNVVPFATSAWAASISTWICTKISRSNLDHPKNSSQFENVWILLGSLQPPGLASWQLFFHVFLSCPLNHNGTLGQLIQLIGIFNNTKHIFVTAIFLKLALPHHWVLGPTLWVRSTGSERMVPTNCLMAWWVVSFAVWEAFDMTRIRNQSLNGSFNQILSNFEPFYWKKWNQTLWTSGYVCWRISKKSSSSSVPTWPLLPQCHPTVPELVPMAWRQSSVDTSAVWF